LLTPDAVMDKLVYAATNPVKDLLVDEAWQWPGVNGYRQLVQRQAFRVRRPAHFFRAGGVMPAEVTLTLVIPPELGDADNVIDELRRRVREVEEATRESRHATGRRVLGRKRVQQQSWRESPASIEPRRTLRPRFAGPVAERVAALVAYKEFLATYDDARRAWKLGQSVVFPVGTYWLARFAPVTVAPLQP
jgi:hypothetical protein